MASSRRPPVSSRHDASAELTRSLTSLSLRAPSSSPGQDSRRLSPKPISRRQSMDFRPSASAPASPRTLSRAPSTPNMRKRASISSLNGTERTGTSPAATPAVRRRSSLMSLNGAPLIVAPEASSPPPKLNPPPQDMYAEAAAILQDSSYGHRYSRPRTSAAELANIVERPERIPAAVVGIAAAQVRSGKDRLAIRKTTRTGKLSDPEVMLVHAHTPVARGKQSWPEELAAMCKAAPDKLKRGELEVPKPYHAGDLYLSAESQEDMEGCVGAVYEGVDLVFGDDAVRRAFVCIRPPGHHCAESQPSGFCFLNNVHIGIARAAKDHGLTHAVILDFDLHHGDGSQAIAWSINDLAVKKNPGKKQTAGITVPNIAYFSMHDINSFPCESGILEIVRNASVNLESHNQFIHNVHMKPFATTQEFWHLYENNYKILITKAGEFLRAAQAAGPSKGREFKAGVFISAGFDASEHEGSSMQRHSVCVPTDFFAQFTADAVDLADSLCGGRVVSVLEGGYSDRAITSGVFAHMSALACSPPNRAEYVPPTFSTGLSGNYTPTTVSWDESWWSLRNLEDLERLTAKTPPKPEKRATSFMSATAASSAKVETPRKTSSSYNPAFGGTSPPPPPTPWEVRAFELSKHFIPVYHESAPIPAIPKADAAPKRVASDRHSVGTTERMTLRERKPKPIPASAPVVDRARRRTTGPVLDSAPVSRAPSRATSTRAPSRAASTVPPVSSRAPASRPASTLPPATRPASTIPPARSPRSASTTASRRTSANVDTLTANMQKVKLTYKNAEADREAAAAAAAAEVARIQREAEELERQIQAAKEAKEAKEKRMAEERGIEERRQMEENRRAAPPPQPEQQVRKSSLPVVKRLAQRWGEGGPVQQQANGTIPVRALQQQQHQFQQHPQQSPQQQQQPTEPKPSLWNGGEIKFGA